MEILASFVSPAIELGKCFKKHFNYLRCIKTNIRDLTDVVRDVEDARVGLQSRVDAATRNLEQILPAVETWLQRAEETGDIKLQIIDPPIPGIWRLKSRYSRSRKAKKRVESMVKLRDSCIFDPISTPSLPAAMVPIALPGRALEFASRKQTEEDIIKAMRGEEVKVIGVCGMGGVGKTMMAKQTMNRAREKEGLFDEVVMVVVGQQTDLLKIQRDIGDWLGMKFEEEAPEPRANRLRARLMGGKRKLIVIDDIWKRIDLESLGIPCKSGSCSVLLTSRDRSVLDAQMIFKVECLNEEEAWFLFKENAGTCVDNSNLLPIATEIVKECNGLPLALVAVARALKGKLSEPVWNDALMQLRKGNPTNIPGVIEDVYNPIKLSYDFLKNQQAESLLFLCSFFPEDYEISLQEELLYYGFGLGMFDEINSLKETRNRIAMLINLLKSRFLILDGRDEHHVKVHDVVRDVTHFIALKEKHAIFQFNSLDCCSRRNPHSDICTMLSVVPKEKILQLPMKLSFPTLQFLWMEGFRGSESELSDDFFEGMEQVKVLYMEYFSIALTPQTMQLLKNLHTLRLIGCTSLETLSAVGELTSLEILICRDCDSITELPMEIGRLNRLMLLDVSYCSNLKTIMPGVISNLVQLEELKMLSSFNGWESNEKGNDKSNVSLIELESLRNLKCLEIEIEDWRLASENVQLSSTIERYIIVVSKQEFYLHQLWIQHLEKTLALNFPMEDSLSLGNWIHTFARGAEKLSLEGGAYQSLDFAGYTQNMSNKRCLSIAGGSEVEKFRVFPILETLILKSLPDLEEIFYDLRLSELEFINLREIYISKCGKLLSLFSSLALIKSLSQLQTLVISECDSMEEVFWMELEEKDYGKSACITFPKLESLSLRNMPRLTTFCKGINGIINIEFPRLNDLRISDCPKLISFINTGAAAVSDENHMNSSSAAAAHVNLFCNTKQQDVTLTFGSLNYLSIGGYENDISYLWCHHIPHLFFAGLNQLHIWKCGNIQNLFSYSIVENLVNLKTLYIGQCNEMVYVIGDDVNTETTSQTNPQILIFHKLEVLKLFSLPKLQIFSQGKWDLQFPSLERLDVHECPLLGSLSTTNLEDSCSAHPDNVHLFCNTKITFGRLNEDVRNGWIRE